MAGSGRTGTDLEALRAFRRLRLAHLLGAGLLASWLAAAGLLHWLWFGPAHRTGLFNVNSSVEAAALWVAGAFVAAVHVPALLVVQRRARRALRGASGEGGGAGLPRLRSALAQAQAVCALTGAAGFGAFLATGDWRSFLFLLGVSGAGYAQAWPGPEWREALEG